MGQTTFAFITQEIFLLFLKFKQNITILSYRTKSRTIQFDRQNITTAQEQMEEDYNEEAQSTGNESVNQQSYSGNNEDLIKLRQINTAFVKLNQSCLQDEYQYYSFTPQYQLNLNLNQPSMHCDQLQVPNPDNNQCNTQRSNSLLYTLSQKDDDETRPTTNTQIIRYHHPKNIDFLTQNINRFGVFQQNSKNQSLNVNNTILNCGLENPCVQSDPSDQNDQIFCQKKQNQHPGFSKYQQFAIKISKLFNIQVEDLQAIYNQLRTQKDAYNEQVMKQDQTSESNQISDSQVMKRLFSYALQIKNSHNQLKNMISTIDQRKQRYSERSVQHTPQNRQIQNISINFMLEQENKCKVEQMHREKCLNQDKTKRFRNYEQRSLNNEIQEQNASNFRMQNFDSKNTIIEKLVGQKNNRNNQLISELTIQSEDSYDQQNRSISKPHKLKKKSRVNQKIKLITQELQSLKRQIDQQSQLQQTTQAIPIGNVIQRQNFSKKYVSTQSQNGDRQNRQTSTVSNNYPNRNMTESTQKIIQNKKRQNIIRTYQSTTQQQPHNFGNSSFTYVKQVQNMHHDDVQISRKIQQTIQTCIVKSPSKKSVEINKKIQKEYQKIIAERVQCQKQQQKFSFKKSKFVSNENAQNGQIPPPSSSSRQKLFKFINERKSLRQKQSQNISSNNNNQYLQRNSRLKNSNNAYLQDQNKNVQCNVQLPMTNKIFYQNKINQKIQNQSINNKSKFITKNVLKNGKIVTGNDYNSQQIQFQPKIQRQGRNDHKKTATFGFESTKQIIDGSNQNSQKYMQYGNQNKSQQNILTSPAIQETRTTYQVIRPQNSYNNIYPLQTQIIRNDGGKTDVRPGSSCNISIRQINGCMHSAANSPSLFYTKTVQSRPLIESQKHSMRSNSKEISYIKVPLQIQSYSPQLISPSKQVITSNIPSNITYNPNSINFNTNSTERGTITQSVAFKTVKPITTSNVKAQINSTAQINRIAQIRKIAPINGIQNLNYYLSPQKPRSFSVQRTRIIQPLTSPKKVYFNNNAFPRFQPPNIRESDLRNKQQIVYNVQKQPQRPFSVPIRSNSPQKFFKNNLKQTLVQKPAYAPVVRENLIRRNVPQYVPVLKTNPVDLPNLPGQMQQNPIRQNNPRGFVTQRKPHQKAEACHIPITTQNLPINQVQSKSNNIPVYPHRPVESNTPKIHINTPPHYQLQQSIMYYGPNKRRSLSNERQYNKKELSQSTGEKNLMSSRKIQSIVHVFPQQSKKMNNNVYTQDQELTSNCRQGVIRSRQGQKIYEPANVPMTQVTRIPNHMRPPKYIPPKQTHGQSISFAQFRSNNSRNSQAHQQHKAAQRSRQSSQSPPIKTYTMGHLLQASRREQYSYESDDKRSNQAVNRSVVRERLDLLQESTPSFGRINDQNISRTVFVSPFTQGQNDLHRSLESKRSSTSRSNSSKKGINLESKRKKNQSHEFFQSSYLHC